MGFNEGVITFMASAASAANPHECVQESVPFIAGFHGQVHSVLVAAWVDAICHVGVDDLFEDILGAGQPAFRADNDKCRWLVNGLEDIVGTKVGS